MPDSTGAERTAAPSRAVSGWTTALVCVAIVAGGVIVGGLLHEPQTELTTAPPTTTSVAPQPTEQHTYVTPPVTYPTQIPGCAVVEPPGEGGLFGWAAVNEFGYDNPAYPWFSGPKAVAMSAALQQSLPEEIDLGFVPVGESLFFQPILGDPDASPEAAKFGGFTHAQSTILRGDRTGSLSVTVRGSGDPVPPCVAGQLDERRVLDDGTTIDLDDTWSETDGVRTLSRTVTAYVPDGSRVTATATDAPNGGEPTGSVPMTMDELIAVATTPGVRVSAPVPAGTPDPPETCSTSEVQTPVVDEATARRWGAVLAGVRLDGLVLDRPLGDLRPGGYGSGGVCQEVRVSADGQQSRLSVVITIGQGEPTVPQRPSESGDRVVTQRELPDGTVVESVESTTAVARSGVPATELLRGVIVTHKSGNRIQVTSRAEAPAQPLSTAQLEAIALAPGLEVS
ncbi:hypothetical protein [Nocardia cyriacigeorgica]|uniref:hypothetical protein n=1 Tax=Nocardia cyriacigeorgica TaxID=135487 RepID=UPI001895E917|nr:hypothetical protein [Nocardia cyriacigeorgica]MBF6440167.1 hypothetical protein [Nocardia cyriacigeorgica]